VELVDQALESAKAILNGNPNSAMFVLYPVPVTKNDQAAAVKKRRILEDKLMATLNS